MQINMGIYYAILLFAIRGMIFASPIEWIGQELAVWCTKPTRVQATMTDDILVLSEIGTDANIRIEGLSLHAQNFLGVEFEYRANGISEKTSGQIFFAGVNGKYVDYFRLPSLNADGQWHKIRMTAQNLSDCTSWDNTGMIHTLRIDPMDQSGGKIEIRYIRVIPVGEFPRGEAEAITVLRIPPTKIQPVIDGNFSEAEWSGTSAMFGGISNANCMLAGRWMSFFIGYDDKNIYFAQRSALPPTPMKLTPEDTVELILGFPKVAIQSFQFNFDGKGNLPPGAHLENWCSVTEKLWYSELSLPLMDLGITDIPYTKECQLQVIRHFRNRHEDVRFHSGTPDHLYAIMIPEKEIPLVSFPGLWLQLGAVNSSYNATWNARNNTDTLVRVAFEISMVSVEMPRLINTIRTIEPQKTATVQLSGQWPWDVVRHLSAEIRDPDNGKVLFRRYFHWDTAQVIRWKDPDPPYKFNIAVYPTAQRLRCQLTCDNQEKLARITDPMVTIADTTGKILSELEMVNKLQGFSYDGVLPDLPENKYFLNAAFNSIDGKKEKLSQSFELRNFDWQKFKLGTERIIVPPFKSLTTSYREVHALQTGFKIAGNGFWDAIYAQGENILSKPVEFIVNGTEFSLLSYREVSSEPDLVIREVDCQYGDLKITVRHEYEQDGFCKIIMKVNPDKACTIKQFDLNFPLKKEFAKFYFASGRGIRMNIKGIVPENKGVCMDSTVGNAQYAYLNGFCPYIWLGEFYKGLAYVCETPRNWGRKQGKPAQEITVDDDAVRLRLHLASTAITVEKPYEIVMAFQPTPVKPRPANTRNLIAPSTSPLDFQLDIPNSKKLVGTTALNHIFFRYDDGLYVPPNNDWGFIEFILQAKWSGLEEVAKFVSDYIDRNNLPHNRYSPLRGATSWWMKCPMDRYLINCAMWYKDTVYRQTYANSRVLCHTWPEFEVYADEWDADTWRPERELNEFAVEPVPSYVDFTLSRVRELVRRGMNGIYYDNVFDSLVRDPVNTAAFEDENGEIRPAFGIFALRELVKRTAVMMHQEGKSFYGHPPIMLHMTDCPLIPVLSFAGMQLDWEMQFGGNTYQNRFPPAYGYVATIGSQAGVFPAVILDDKGCEGDMPQLVRSILAMTFIYDVMYQLVPSAELLRKAPFYAEALKQIFEFGYGVKDTIVFPSWTPDNPVKITPSQVRATAAKRADGAVLLLIGNLGENTDAEFELGNWANGTISDLVSGKEIGIGNRFKLTIATDGYAMVLIKP